MCWVFPKIFAVPSAERIRLPPKGFWISSWRHLTHWLCESCIQMQPKELHLNHRAAITVWIRALKVGWFAEKCWWACSDGIRFCTEGNVITQLPSWYTEYHEHLEYCEYIKCAINLQYFHLLSIVLKALDYIIKIIHEALLLLSFMSSH